MDTRLKTLALICAVQFACVGVGFWVQQQFLGSFSDRAGSEAVWGQIESVDDSILSQLRQSDSQKIDLNALQEQMRLSAPAQPWQFMIVDADWNVMRNGSQPSGSADSSGNIDCQQAAATPVAGGGPLRGILRLDDGEHVASAFAFPQNLGFLVIHVPIASIKLSSAEFLKSLPISTLLSLLWTCTLLGICTYLIFTRVSEAYTSAQLDKDTQSLQKAQSLVRTQDAVIFGLANLAESRDPETGMHLERISLYATTLAQSLRRHVKYRDVVDEEFVRLIGTSSALHDIGKVGIEDAILRKPGRLTDSERKEIQKHPVIGSDCLLKIERRLGASNFLHMAREIARSHHEWWNGGGYPDRRIGHEIPLAARIVSIADVYDALATRRVYKPDLPHVACVGFIKRGAGTQFDPDLVEAFLEVEQQFRRIAELHTDVIRPEKDFKNSSPAAREHVDVEYSRSIDDVSALAAERL